jgi:hypothetical protein
MARYLFPVLLAVALISCVLRKEILNPDTYITYTLRGPASEPSDPSCAGEFRIAPDNDYEFKEVNSILFPANQNVPEGAIIQFTDFTNGRQAHFAIPVEPGVYHINKDSFYEMHFTHPDDSCLISARLDHPSFGVLLEVLEFRKGTGGFLGTPSLEYLAVEFRGTMIVDHGVDGIEEHIVEGHFVYNSNNLY